MTAPTRPAANPLKMRTVSEILDAAKTGGERPSHEECYWAMLALEQIWCMTQRAYGNQIYTPKKDNFAKMTLENNFKTGKTMLAADPQYWLGPSHDWSNQENRKRREVSLKIWDKAVNGELSK